MLSTYAVAQETRGITLWQFGSYQAVATSYSIVKPIGTATNGLATTYLAAIINPAATLTGASFNGDNFIQLINMSDR